MRYLLDEKGLTDINVSDNDLFLHIYKLNEQGTEDISSLLPLLDNDNVIFVNTETKNIYSNYEVNSFGGYTYDSETISHTVDSLRSIGYYSLIMSINSIGTALQILLWGISESSINPLLRKKTIDEIISTL